MSSRDSQRPFRKMTSRSWFTNNRDLNSLIPCSPITGSPPTGMKTFPVSKVVTMIHILNIEGLFVLYPMKAVSREKEKNPLIIKEQSTNYKHFIDVERRN